MSLLNVQKAALKASNGVRGFAYFMEQGLGKTLTDYTDFMTRVEEGKVRRKVTVCPNSFKGGWVDEANKHDIRMDHHVFNSGDTYANNSFLRRSFDRPPHLIVNYEAIRSPATRDYILSFIRNRPAWITFDESIQLKNNKAEQTMGALGLARHFDYVRILSGKPIAQGPHDLWAQMRTIGLLNGTNYYSFKTHFCRMGGYMRKQVIGAQNEEDLANLINGSVFRATKSEWTDLPPKMYSQREYDMSPKMRQYYRQMEQEFVLWLENGQDVSVNAAITKYIKLAQISSGFIIKDDQNVEELVNPMDNPRIKLIRGILDNEVIGKAIIVFHHKYSFDMLGTIFMDKNPAYITGGMNQDQVRYQQNRFNNDPECRIMLAQERAAKYGFTLLGGPEPENNCSTMIFFENTFSLDDRSQVEDRNHRHGQTAHSCLYLDLFGTPLDMRVNQALQNKEEIFQAVFSLIRKS